MKSLKNISITVEERSEYFFLPHKGSYSSCWWRSLLYLSSYRVPEHRFFLGLHQAPGQDQLPAGPGGSPPLLAPLPLPTLRKQSLIKNPVAEPPSSGILFPVRTLTDSEMSLS